MFAVWFDTNVQQVVIRKLSVSSDIRGSDTGMKMNAFPVADEGEADRWSGLFDRKIPPRTMLKPQLIAKDGEVMPSFAEANFLREFFDQALASALSKEKVETPRDDELISTAVAHCDVTVALWEDKAAPLGYKILPISGWANATSGDTAKENLRFNAYLGSR